MDSVLSAMSNEEVEVIKQADGKRWKHAACEDGWVRAHSALRSDMAQLASGFHACIQQLEAGKELKPWQISNVQTFWLHFEHHVHHHHDNEELFVFPCISKLATLPPKFSDDHVTLVKAQDEIGALIKNLTANNKDAHLVMFIELKDKMAVLMQSMDAHFVEEEETGLILLRKVMSHKEFLPTEKAMLKGITSDDMGWILHSMPDDKTRRYFMTTVSGVPGIIQTLVMFPALRRYRNEVIRLMEEVEAGERIRPQPTGCFA